MNDQITDHLPPPGPAPGYLDHARIGPISRSAVAASAAATALATRAAPADVDRLFALGDAARASAATLLRAAPHEVALAPSTSNGLFTVAAALRGPGTVLVPRNEFPANLYPWLRFAGRGGPDVRLVDPVGWRHITPDQLRRHLTPQVTALTVSAVDSLTGYVAPLADLKEVLGPDRLLIVDAIQGLGAVPLDTDAVDVLVSGGQKWLRAGWGAALLMIRDRCAERLAPGLGGWAGVEDPFAGHHPAPPLPGAAAHLATNPDFPAAAAIGAAVDELLGQGGPAAVGTRIRATLAELLDRARQAGAEVLLDGIAYGERAGIGTFRLPGHDSATVHRALEAAGVVTTRRGEWIRLSPHVSTPAVAADLLADVLHTLSGRARTTRTTVPATGDTTSTTSTTSRTGTTVPATSGDITLTPPTSDTTRTQEPSCPTT
ncbi:aminotransferase class V-fold PLP-dependent enzyme [Streptomyces sp. NPDC056144]|uniref:aminotransferase class V-fold PLP-dependent enzyme n=1 Tax=unclassified Streptomyces TaxID=2593676 RepID=UPI0035DB7F4D